MSEPPKILKISTFASKSVIHGFGTRFFSLPELRDSLPSLNIITLTQTHSSKVLLNSGGEGDGVISRDPGTILVIKTADCLPVLIKDDEERIVAALHAGWKGLCKGIIFKGIAKIKNLGFNKKNLRVALGPSIGPCCYSVGKEVFECFKENGLPFVKRGENLDLPSTAIEHLTSSGVNIKKISVLPLCTKCTPELFYSHRRGEKGRMISFIGLLKPETEVKIKL